MSKKDRDTLGQLAPLIVILLVMACLVAVFFYKLGSDRAKKDFEIDTASAQSTSDTEQMVEEALPAKEALPAEEAQPAKEALPAEEALPSSGAFAALEESESGAQVAPPPKEAFEEFETEENPLGMYIVDVSWASTKGGLYAIKEDGNFYSIFGLLPNSVAKTYGVGYTRGHVMGNEIQLYLYGSGDGVTDVETETKYTYVSAGKFPILTVSKGEDEVVFYDMPYSAIPNDNIRLRKTEFIGYTIEASQYTRYRPVQDFAFDIAPEPLEEVGVYDKNGNLVQDVHRLNQDEEYAYECYVGTAYREVRLPASCRCYTRTDYSDVAYEIPAERTKNGYVRFDLSDVEPGLYCYQDAVFEIVE